MKSSYIPSYTKHLTFYILFAFVTGTIIGAIMGPSATKFQIMSQVFLRLIKMVIGPLVLLTLVTGIVKIGDIKKFGKMGAATLLYFLAASLVSIVIGLVAGNLFEPGNGLTISSLNSTQGTPGSYSFHFNDFILHLFPVSLFDALAKNEILQIIVFAVFLGVALLSLKEKAHRLLETFETLTTAIFKMVGYIMLLAPPAVFGAIAATIGERGIGIFSSYFLLISEFYLCLLVFTVLLAVILVYALKQNLKKVFTEIREPLALTFSTASSEAAFPKLMESLGRLGIHPQTSGFVLPMGYSFNLDGSMMYMSFAFLFIAQAYRIPLSTSQQITAVLILLISSKGIAGVPRASLIVITSLLSSFHIPEQGIYLILGIDHILDMGRSAVNLAGNTTACFVIEKWFGAGKEPV